MFQVGDNIEILYIVATSEFERESWIKALRQCKLFNGHLLSVFMVYFVYYNYLMVGFDIMLKCDEVAFV